MESQETHSPEHTLWSGKRSQWCYAGHWFAGLIIAAAMAAAIYVYQRSLGAWLPWLYGAPLVVLLVVSFITAAARSRWTYRVTVPWSI